MKRTPLKNFFYLFFLLSLTACSMMPHGTATFKTQKGIASWYGKDFHGKLTASGEVYNMYAMTAAHKRLPLGTIVKVRNLDNGREIKVTINDRGPYVRGRIIDLSYTAAKKIGIVETGTARVRIKTLGRDAKYIRYIRVDESGTGKKFTVQLGAFTDRDNAENLKAAITLERGDAYIMRVKISGRTFYRVRVGKFSSKEKAIKTAKKLAYEGFEVVVMRR